MPTISEAEWTAELERLAEACRSEHRSSGLTGPEWATKLGVGINRMRALLAEAKSRGLLVTSSGYREAVDGRRAKLVVYAIKKSPAGSGRLVRAKRKKGAGS